MSPTLLVLSAALGVLGLAAAVPVGPFPNATSSRELTDESCVVGGVLRAAGAEWAGADACERCACAAGGGVRCARTRCQPRAGCKALHRPDQCCPTYQCDCEHSGRVYGNGEKLVDPLDPCRVCYCQGGEVVCRRIACFVRDDCRPRRVPGRCCPEYDNCPLRGVTTLSSISLSSESSTDDEVGSAPPAPAPAPREPARQEITIKEITPVSEIPVITEVKIKEVLPSAGADLAEYASSKAPLIVREATTQKYESKETDVFSKTEAPAVIEMQPSWSPVLLSSPPAEVLSTSSENNVETEATNDSPPSKISFSTQDSINSDIYPSILTSFPTAGSPSVAPQVVQVFSSKAPVIEEDDASLLDHNPFPPLPDDLSVLGNHEDENVQEQNVYGDHVSTGQEVASEATAVSTTEAVTVGEPITTTFRDVSETSTAEATTKSVIDTSTVGDMSTTTSNVGTISTKMTGVKESPMLNLRSAIPTDILNIPSSVPEDITGELDEAGDISTATEDFGLFSTSKEETSEKYEEIYTHKPQKSAEITTYPSSTVVVTDPDTSTTTAATETTIYTSRAQTTQEHTTSSISKSNIATEVTSQTELSSLPIETSDQNPHDISENIAKERETSSTVEPITEELTTTKISSPIETEVITVSRAGPLTTDNNKSSENVETTEFILTPFGSSESATDAVELIKISADPAKSADLIEPASRKKNNVLTDLINLVGDVASIGDHTDSPDFPHHAAATTAVFDSEELIPVNAGYKSKNSNRNVNSITEIPVKSRSHAPPSKQRIVEIEGDDGDGITDSPPPDDRVEPTTRRPTIDNVSDDTPGNKTHSKDIEIITKSYVPTINRRPTKVVMKKNNEKPILSDHTTEDSVASSVTAEIVTEGDAATSTEPAATPTPAPATSAPAQ